MSLNRNEKAAVVTDVAAQVARAQTLALAEYRGLTVEHLNALRRQARERGVYLHVLKNTLARRAVAGTPFECALPPWSGGSRLSETRWPRRRSWPTSPSATQAGRQAGAYAGRCSMPRREGSGCHSDKTSCSRQLLAEASPIFRMAACWRPWPKSGGVRRSAAAEEGRPPRPEPNPPF